MTKPTAKNPAASSVNVSTIRLDPQVRLALAKAAEDDRRSSSALFRIILEDWLHQRGYLKKTAGGWVFSGEDAGKWASGGGKKPGGD
jgi:hypothetical protein